MLTGSGRTRRWVALLLILVSGLLAGCASIGEYTGEDAATDELERLQQEVVAVLTDWPRNDDPVDRARQVGELSHPMQGPHSAEPAYAVLVEPLDWRLVDPAKVVEVRLRVDAAAYNDPGFSTRNWGAGTAERCLRVEIGRSSAEDLVDTIDCAGRTARPVPPYVPPPPLDAAMLEKAMRRSSFAEAEQAATVAFPAPDFVVVGEVIDGTWAIVVVRRGEYECVGATRTVGGKIKAWFPDRRRMQPGEGGCDPVAFVRPI